MKTAFALAPNQTVTLTVFGKSPVLEVAAAEAQRLLGRLGVSCATRAAKSAKGYALTLTPAGARPMRPDTAFATVRHDGYRLAVAAGGVSLSAPTPKGALNALYDFAERLGFVFLTPGADGEWAPQRARPVPAGCATVNPRFPYRGMFGGTNTPPYSQEEWLVFFAKLRFNAQSGGDTALCTKLGIRPEQGGHGMAELLPRSLFEKRPELFRMFQPEDFSGKRMADSNFCPTHPETARLVRDNFRKQLARHEGAYAIHAWADDLPAGGWCMCSRCRALTASDQSQLAMNMQAEAIRLERKPMRVPTIAYHDTLFPGRLIRPARECFLLYAPRERCYAHALNDPKCSRNRVYLEALHAWMKQFEGYGDAHTFEYYCDQILYRGHYAFLPEVVLEDMRVYEQAGIESHMTLQVGGAVAAPDYNLLLFARAHWDGALTTKTAIADLAERIDAQDPVPWKRYLAARAAAYTAAFAICDLGQEVYFDYRFMPEVEGERGKALAATQRAGARTLAAAAAALAREARHMEPRNAALAQREAARARFEAADMLAMHFHQTGLNHLTDYLSTHKPVALKRALAALKRTLTQLDRASALQRSAGGEAAQGTKAWGYYPAFVESWSKKEIEAKIATFSQAL